MRFFEVDGVWRWLSRPVDTQPQVISERSSDRAGEASGAIDRNASKYRLTCVGVSKFGYLAGTAGVPRTTRLPFVFFLVGVLTSSRPSSCSPSDSVSLSLLPDEWAGTGAPMAGSGDDREAIVRGSLGLDPGHS